MLPKGIADKNNNLAFRISNHEVPTQLIEQLQHPIVCTSADIEEHTNPHDFEDIQQFLRQQKNQPDYAFNTGGITERVPATIVRVDKYEQLQVVRQGGVVIEGIF